MGGDIELLLGEVTVCDGGQRIEENSVIPGLQRREVGSYCFFLIRLLHFGNLKFEEKHSPVGQ
jgi:hypothetical protein